MNIIKSRKFHISVFLIIIVSTFLIGIKVPNTIPINWDAKGNVNQYGSKYILLLLMPLVMFITYIIIEMLIRSNNKKNTNILVLLQFYFIILFAGMHYYFVLNTIIEDLNIFSFLSIPIFLAYIYLYKFLKNVNQNKISGIRTKWTLSNEYVWHKTNNLGSKLFLLNGALIIIGVFIPNYFFYLIFIPLIVIVISLIIYSYVIYNISKKHKVE